MYILGLAIFLLGLAFFLRNLGVLSFAASFWYVFYPLIIMLFGLGILAATYEGRKVLKRLKKLFSKED